ncbi:MAG: hypothetical protein KIT52_04415 [Anaerolineae bacterium]|nr:hypothetical protein [Anaerolineae bacterium]
MTSQVSSVSDKASGRLGSLIRPRYLLLVLLLVAVAVFAGVNQVRSSTIPTISITSVVTDTSVTIQTYNFPANQNFTVTMGAFGTKGVGGIVVGTLNSGVGGSFSATYNVPAQLKGSRQIAIRLQTAHTYPYYAYNWFWNNTTTGDPGTGGIPGYTGIPTFSITTVDVDKTVTIKTDNFPANQTFTVRMGPFGSRGVNGIVVGTLQSGVGGALTATFNIPAQLQKSYQIAIRAETAHANPFFAYNWFYNNTTGTGGNPPPTVPPGPIYTGIPTFTVCSVVQNGSVTIKTANFPPNQTFTVTMGAFGTQGIGGVVVGTINSGTGEALSPTFGIPPALAGYSRIAIRLQTGQAYPFFAYNWFWNNTATVC